MGHCSVPTQLSLSPQKLPWVIWCWMRGRAVSTGLLHLCTRHLGAFFPFHAAAGFLLHMFSLPQLEAVRGSLIYTLYTGRIEVCKILTPHANRPTIIFIGWFAHFVVAIFILLWADAATPLGRRCSCHFVTSLSRTPVHHLLFCGKENDPQHCFCPSRERAELALCHMWWV